MRSRILVVEDDPMVAEVVARYLEHDGHVVECVADGVEAMRRALDAPPDLMVLGPSTWAPGRHGSAITRSCSPRASSTCSPT
ncbi:response regulator transcription factor [Nonomuraea sp. NPDC050663]|uniref:response regulator transcription factor n=1 Tax=Nonomuraea sp. NPDC050663 TaxID=3364370 RepID=UPI0037B728FC